MDIGLHFSFVFQGVLDIHLLVGTFFLATCRPTEKKSHSVLSTSAAGSLVWMLTLKLNIVVH